jgi:hypothetical protein
VNHSSLSRELPVVPEPDRSRSLLSSTLIIVGVCSLLVLAVPTLARSLKTLLASGARVGWMPSLLEVSLASLGVLALVTLVVHSVGDVRSRWRGRRRRQRNPWDHLLMDEELQDPALRDFPSLSRPTPAPVQVAEEAPSSAPVPRLSSVEGTPWPLGVRRERESAPANPGSSAGRRLAPVTRLGFARSTPVPEQGASVQGGHDAATRDSNSLELPLRGYRRRMEPSPVYFTPYPFSVWSFHDNLPDYEFEPMSHDRSWLWAGLALVGGVLLVALCWSLLAPASSAAHGGTPL